jgi:hypothetical protein
MAALRGATPPEEISASTKRRTSRAIPSTMPPAGHPLNSRLCTCKIRGFPTL